MSWWSDLVDIIAQGPVQGGAEAVSSEVTGTTIGPPGANSNISGSLSGLGGLLTTINAIWANLRDYKMWRSLGWLALGIVLMLLGASMWVGMSSKIPPVLPV